MRRHTEDETDDAPKTVHVPLFQMDSRKFDNVQRSVRDATVNDLERLRALRDEAYKQYDERSANAWRGASDEDFGDDDMTGDAKLHVDALNPSSQHFNLDAAKARRVQAYADHEAEARESWRKGKF